jgi:hypothetical protein
LTNSGLIIEHFLQGSSHINRLTEWVNPVTSESGGDAYMDRSESFLHVIGCEKVEDRGQFQQQIVFESKYWRRAHQRGLRENSASNLLSPALSICQMGAITSTKVGH